MEQEGMKIRLKDLHEQISAHLEKSGKKAYGYDGFYYVIRRILKNQPDLLPITEIKKRNFQITGPLLPEHMALFEKNNPSLGRRLVMIRFNSMAQFQKQLEEIQSNINEREKYRFQIKNNYPSFRKRNKKTINLISIIKDHYEGIVREGNPIEKLNISGVQLTNALNNLHPDLNATVSQIHRNLRRLKEGKNPILPPESFKKLPKPPVRTREMAEELFNDPEISGYFKKFLSYKKIIFGKSSINLPGEYLDLPLKIKEKYAKKAFVEALTHTNPITKIYIMVSAAGNLQKLFKPAKNLPGQISYNDEISYRQMDENIDSSGRKYGKIRSREELPFDMRGRITKYLFEMQTEKHKKINSNHAIWYHLSRIGRYSSSAIARHFGVADQAVKHALNKVNKKVLKIINKTF
ncbi:hypothetical protein HY989_07035 [Candidatus Micrarchaeota archaeon]|nr:hypothetical protein [Candidatus Micrarchaeota archaeon]